MDKETYQEAKKNFAEVEKLLQDGNLTSEEKQNLETLRAQLAGVLLNSWLPVDWGRRGIMIILFCIGVFGIISEKYYFLLAWLIMLIFSPRLIGEVSYLFGKIFHRQA